MKPIASAIDSIIGRAFHAAFVMPERIADGLADDWAAYCITHPASRKGLRMFTAAAAQHEEAVLRLARARRCTTINTEDIANG